MKKFLLGFIMGIIIMVPVSALGQTAYEKISAYVNPDIKVAVEGEHVDLDLAPIVYDQRTYLPVREIVEKVMGYEVNWNQETTTVEIAAPDIWPIADVNIKVGDELERTINFTDWGYDVFYTVDESLSKDEVEKMIKRVQSKIEQHETMIEASKNPNSGRLYTDPTIVEAYRSEMEKLKDVLPKWESLLESKKQEQPAE